jgi:hypothetical protein
MKVGNSYGLLIVALTGCASYPKAHDGTPLEVERGYWASYTQFKQRGKRVDRASAKEVLAQHEEAAPAAQRAAVLDVFTGVTAIAGGAMLGVGIAGLTSDNGVSDSTAGGLLLGGGLSLGASVAIGFGAEGSYISAVRSYNQPGLSSP